MLPPAHRMRRPADFATTVRRGRRVRRGAVVVHHRIGLTDGAATVGFVVGRTVGNSVTRHRVSRRLRAQVAARLALLPAGSGTVVRALPDAAGATSAQFGADLEAAFATLCSRSRPA